MTYKFLKQFLFLYIFRTQYKVGDFVLVKLPMGRQFKEYAAEVGFIHALIVVLDSKPFIDHIGAKWLEYLLYRL